jgi:4-amino-4-deoxy-L-arabinose transferase-like glycosyltransferase
MEGVLTQDSQLPQRPATTPAATLARMALLRRVFEPQTAGPDASSLSVGRRAPLARPIVSTLASLRRFPEVGGLIGLAALLNLWTLGRNGWANTYYSAAVRSMASNWHDFLYASLDRSGVMSVDKPPLSLWVQALSVRVFGFHPLAILVPQALMGIVSVVLVYDLVRRRFGRLGGLVAGLALATTPIAVAMFRDNNPDALLTLCAVAAVWFAVRGIDDGRTRWLVLAGLAAGLGFETKMLVAFVVVPGIAVAWLWVAPRGRLAAVRQLLAGGAAMLGAAAAWPLLLTLTPASERPWISGTSDNGILSLIFSYNGLGRVTGQQGGPGGARGGSVFGEGTGPLRLLNTALGGQDGWLLGLAVAGAIAVALTCRARRRDPRMAWLAVVAGAFAVTAVLFSFAGGIFHPYYVVLLAPFTAALVGAGVASVVRVGLTAALAGFVALAAGVVCEFVVLGENTGQLPWLRVVLGIVCGGAAGALFLFRSARVRAWAMGVGVAALLIAPTVWSFDTLGYAVAPTFPSGGPVTIAAGPGGFASSFGGAGFGGRFGGRSGFNVSNGRRGRGAAAGPGVGSPPGLFGGGGQTAVPGQGVQFGGVQPFGSGFPGAGRGFGGSSALSAETSYARSHGGGTVAVASQLDAAAAILETNANMAGIGGFTGQESDPSISWLAGEVASGRVRWVLVTQIVTTGVGVRPGARVAMNAVVQACTPVTAVFASFYDCAGRAEALRALGATLGPTRPSAAGA